MQMVAEERRRQKEAIEIAKKAVLTNVLQDSLVAKEQKTFYRIKYDQQKME